MALEKNEIEGQGNINDDDIKDDDGGQTSIVLPYFDYKKKEEKFQFHVDDLLLT